ncbi:MAG: hypothetical protein SF053_13405 [Bacteroidia bacterium]|nr:hypothetical protein [Bacteroidia bacterium]
MNRWFRIVGLVVLTSLTAVTTPLAAQVLSKSVRISATPAATPTYRSNFRSAAPATEAAQPQPSPISVAPGAKGEYMLTKEVPDREPPKIVGTGKPVRLYVVQLARFEEMPFIPTQFPIGSFIWNNPDHPTEKMLLSGFYYSIEEANKAALEWKKKGIMFKDAFARTEPFMIRYE